jgi:hypothetical protein
MKDLFDTWGVDSPYRLALDQGRCLIFADTLTGALAGGGAGAESAPAPLSKGLAFAALQELVDRLPAWIEQAQSTQARADACVDTSERFEVLRTMLSILTDAFAVSRITDRDLLDHLGDEDVAKLMGRFQLLFDQLSDSLESQREVLAELNGTRWIENMREALRPEYRGDSPNAPWWLN